MEIEAIAKIHTDFPEKFGIPRQSGVVAGTKGVIEFVPKFRNPDALRGIGEFSHLWILWSFSENVKEHGDFMPTVAPPRLGGKAQMGVFATRSSFRPNGIALSCVKLEGVELDGPKGPRLLVSGVDMLDGTPIYDIKPYLPYVDAHPEAKAGWAAAVSTRQLCVEMPETLAEMIDEADRQDLIEVIAQDPRTAFINDSTRIWGVAFRKYNVRFTVNDEIGKATVCEVSYLV